MAEESGRQRNARLAEVLLFNLPNFSRMEGMPGPAPLMK